MGIKWGRTLVRRHDDAWQFVALMRVSDEGDNPFVAICDEFDLVEPDDTHRTWIDKVASMCRFALEPEGFAYLVFDMMLADADHGKRAAFADPESAERWLEDTTGASMETFHTPQI